MTATPPLLFLSPAQTQLSPFRQDPCDSQQPNADCQPSPTLSDDAFDQPSPDASLLFCSPFPTAGMRTAPQSLINSPANTLPSAMEDTRRYSLDMTATASNTTPFPAASTMDPSAFELDPEARHYPQLELFPGVAVSSTEFGSIASVTSLLGLDSPSPAAAVHLPVHMYEFAHRHVDCHEGSDDMGTPAWKPTIIRLKAPRLPTSIPGTPDGLRSMIPPVVHHTGDDCTSKGPTIGGSGKPADDRFGMYIDVGSVSLLFT